MMIIGDDILEKKYGYDIGSCGMASLFILGTLLGPIILIPGTLYYYYKAAINPSSDDDNSNAIRGHFQLASMLPTKFVFWKFDFVDEYAQSIHGRTNSTFLFSTVEPPQILIPGGAVLYEFKS